MLRLTILTATVAVAGCGPSGPGVMRFEEAQMQAHDAPPGADPGACWGRDETPARIETVTEQVLVRPAQRAADGTLLRKAAYRTETSQQIVEERRDLWFETPCPESLTPEVTAALQRALAARGLYEGPISAEMDRPTRDAIRAFQRRQGLDSDILSIAAAKRLGVLAYDRDETAERK